LLTFSDVFHGQNFSPFSYSASVSNTTLQFQAGANLLFTSTNVILIGRKLQIVTIKKVAKYSHIQD